MDFGSLKICARCKRQFGDSFNCDFDTGSFGASYCLNCDIRVMEEKRHRYMRSDKVFMNKTIAKRIADSRPIEIECHEITKQKMKEALKELRSLVKNKN